MKAHIKAAEMTQATLSLVKDHANGRHVKDHPECPVCAQRGDMGIWYRESNIERAIREHTLPAKVWA